MKTLTKLILSLTVVLFFSCNGKQSLQEYYVDNQDNENFLSLDLPSSLLMVNDNMTKEQQETLSTVKKVNVLAFPKKEENTVAFEEEKSKINSILKDDKFHVLMKFNQNGMNAKVLYLGEEDAIDEIIIYGEDYDMFHRGSMAMRSTCGLPDDKDFGRHNSAVTYIWLR